MPSETLSVLQMPSACDRWWGKSHCWGKWARAGDPQNILKDGKIIGQSLVQRRACERCGFEELNKQTLWVQQD